jgi:hypothetical protein
MPIVCLRFLFLCTALVTLDISTGFKLFNAKDSGDVYDGKVIKGNRNALFLVENGARRQFPDFYTFTHMGFNVTNIMKIKDDILNSIPLGPMVKAIPAPPPFRPDDYMYHEQCGDPDKMVGNIHIFAYRIAGSQHPFFMAAYSQRMTNRSSKATFLSYRPIS